MWNPNNSQKFKQLKEEYLRLQIYKKNEIKGKIHLPIDVSTLLQSYH
jgi:hypothetical protein